MTDNNVKSKWRIDSIEYSGTGDIPLFILRNGDKKIYTYRKRYNKI